MFFSKLRCWYKNVVSSFTVLLPVIELVMERTIYRRVLGEPPTFIPVTLTPSSTPSSLEVSGIPYQQLKHRPIRFFFFNPVNTKGQIPPEWRPSTEQSTAFEQVTVALWSCGRAESLLWNTGVFSVALRVVLTKNRICGLLFPQWSLHNLLKCNYSYK